MELLTKDPFLTLLGSWGLHSKRTLAPSSFVQFIPGLLSLNNEESLTGGVEAQWRCSSVRGTPHGQDSSNFAAFKRCGLFYPRTPLVQNLRTEGPRGGEAALGLN